MIARAQTLSEDRGRPSGRAGSAGLPGQVSDLRRLADAVEPAVPSGAMAHERVLPVLPAMASLLPDGGLRRGAIVSVSGSTSLALALAAGPSGAGSWCAAVSPPALGLVAAAEMGIVLERFPLIAVPAAAWTRSVSAALEAFDLVLAWPPRRGLLSSEARRLAALARERGAVLVTCGAQGWPERTDLRLEAIRSEWLGLETGHGRLLARRLDVIVTGRGSASVARRSSLWLPDPDGAIAIAESPVASRDGRDRIIRAG